MTTPLRIVAVSGSLQQPSRTRALTVALLQGLERALVAERREVQTHLVDLGEVSASLGNTFSRAHAGGELESHLRAIETADALIVASPVYRASYTGLFKHLFDLIHHEALFDVPVLLAATGGSERHALVIDHQLRPLLSFFQAHTLPVGVYGSEADFHDYRVSSEPLNTRIALAIERAAPVIAQRPRRHGDVQIAA
ncbi:FMN reductase [Paraburkholderia sp. MMS20-SJTR3]|uniref:FMN reductase n=1 Tax=Paraburkholderia sejongensis TaxID=2886946 RepID=A0ABS8JRY4_9BURK|nr:FMN reductase [Paraburkholderia sp. MMS20-SJTR3]MCC8392488.1 FMN reductase [Paraburkholderia sp. MMS20-SJTR3]